MLPERLSRGLGVWMVTLPRVVEPGVEDKLGEEDWRDPLVAGGRGDMDEKDSAKGKKKEATPSLRGDGGETRKEWNKRSGI